MSDEKLRALMGELTVLVAESITRTGSARTETVRQFIRAHRDVPEFKKLAIALILTAEALQAEGAA